MELGVKISDSEGYIHQQMKYYLKEFYIPNVESEVYISEIVEGIPYRRFADLVNKDKRIVYECQYSNIPFSEFYMRIIDYLMLGYKIVWIFYYENWVNIKKIGKGMFISVPNVFMFLHNEEEPIYVFDNEFNLYNIVIKNFKYAKGTPVKKKRYCKRLAFFDLFKVSKTS